MMTKPRAPETDDPGLSYPVVEDLLMFISRSGAVTAHRLRLAARLVMLVPLLLTLLAACGNGTGGGPAY